MRSLTIKTLLRGAIRLLSYYLKYKNDPADSTYKDYCRTQIVLLEGLQRIYLTLPVILRDLQNTIHTFARYSDAYRQYRYYYTYYLDLCLAPLQKLSRKVQARIDKEEFEERINNKDTDPAYQDKLVQRPQHNPNTLGNREVDLNTDWSSFIGKYAILFPNIYYYPQREYQKEEIAANPAELRIDLQSTGQKELLNPEQRLVYDTVIGYYNNFLAGQTLPQLLLNIDSRIGTSKSYIINLTSAYLQTKARLRRSLVLRLAPTSIAAYAIDSQTLYKLLKLPISSRRNF